VRKGSIPLLKKQQKLFLYLPKANTQSVSHGISNLLLGEKLVRASAPKILNSFGKFGGNPWDALRASRILASKKPMSSLMVSLLYQVRTYFQNKVR